MKEAFLLTLAAGLSTGIGGLLAVLRKKTSEKTMAFSLGMAAGVMIFVSLGEMLGEAVAGYSAYFSHITSALKAVTMFLLGLFIAVLIGKLIPEYRAGEGAGRSAAAAVAAIVLHNLPEGMITMWTARSDMRLGGAMAFAVALHNIPEGIAVAVPLVYLTGKRFRAAFAALITGLAEPIGALVLYYITEPFMNELSIAGMMASISGIMIYVSFAELLPACLGYGVISYSICGIITGIVIMTVGIYGF